MRVEQLGDGEPEIAVIGGIHGDEPCGVRAVDRVMEADPDVDRPVKLIVANEEAIERRARYVEEDLNRAFPGNPDGDTHEARLAHELLQEIRGCITFSMHSTQSYASPFALVDETDGQSRSVCSCLSIEAVVETARFSEGRLIYYPDVVEVECGLQGSVGAAENAYALTLEFLSATGVLASAGDSRPDEDVPVFRLERQIPKPTGTGYAYEVFVENFERVGEGEVYATANDEQLVAEEPFYPVLLSPYGYADVFGYAASLVGRLDDHEVESAAEGPGHG